MPTNEPGQWLRRLLADDFGQPNTFVPRRFAAYVRILHPIERDRPKAPETWETADFTAMIDLETEPGSWKDLAAATSSQLGPYTQSAEILSPKTSVNEEWPTPDGWCYGQSIEGNLEVHTLARVAAVWEGWGAECQCPFTRHESRPLPTRLAGR